MSTYVWALRCWTYAGVPVCVCVWDNFSVIITFDVWQVRPCWESKQPLLGHNNKTAILLVRGTGTQNYGKYFNSKNVGKYFKLRHWVIAGLALSSSESVQKCHEIDHEVFKSTELLMIQRVPSVILNVFLNHHILRIISRQKIILRFK